MTPELVAKYDLRLPRYTSYPTSPHFAPAVGAETYARWLGELPPDLPLSLYLHVAYCAELCWFCGCHTKITQQYRPVAEYLACLLKEVDTVADHLPGRMTARHVHFGGGSPTILSAEDFARTIAHLRARFDLAADAEIAVELDPRTTDEAYIRTMGEAGVTRASVGVQDFNREVQEAVNRVQPYALVADVFGWLRKYGIEEVNMDLMYGLPYQSVDSVVATIDQAMTLAPRRIALFGYAHVPWMKKHQRLVPEQHMPDMAERWAQYQAAHARLIEHGYVVIGLDHFARPDDPMALAMAKGALHRNFQGYTTDAAPCLLGFGASAIGSLPQGYVGNEGELHAYRRLVSTGQLAARRGIALNDDDRVRRALIERVMCDLGVDVEAVAAAFGADPAQFDADLDRLKDLEADGVVVRQGRRVSVTEPGRPLIRAVAAVFDRYLKAGEQRHSKAV